MSFRILRICLLLPLAFQLGSCLPGAKPAENVSSTPRAITAFLDTVIQEWEGQDQLTEEYRRLTGIDLSIVQPPHQQYMDSLFIHLTSGRLPDVCEILPEYLPQFVNEGLAVPLDGFLEEAEYLTGIPDEVLEAVRYVDGKIYGFPARDGGGCITYLRGDWLETLGLEEPGTWEELLTVFRAFTFGDPDGNGVDDTYGYTDMYAASQDWYNRSVFLGARAEIHFDGERWVDGFSQPSIRGALERLILLYREGLIDPGFVTNTTFSARTKFFNGEVGAITYWANHWARNLVERTRATVGDRALVRPLPAIEGARYIRRISPLLVVTSGAQDPSFVFKNFIDRQYDKAEIQTLFTYGVEGYHWSKISGEAKFLPNPKDPYQAPYTRAFVPPITVLNDWDQPMAIDPLVVPALEYLNADPEYERIRAGGNAYERYFIEIERTLKPDAITRIVTGEMGIDEGLAYYAEEAEKLSLAVILDELNGVVK